MYRVPLVCRGVCSAVRVRPVSLLYHTTPSHVRQLSNVVTSPLPPIEHSPLDLYRHVYQDFPKFGNRTAVVDGITGQEFSYNRIDELTSKFSSALNRNGFKPNDVIAIVAPNTTAFPVIFFGTIASGGVVTTCNSTFTSNELSFQFKNSDAKIVATVASLLPTVQEAMKETNVEKIIVIDGDSQRGGDGVVSYQSLLDDSGSLFSPVSSDVHSTAALPYSSGTTGLPKGVMLTHHNITSNISQMHHPELFNLGEHSRLVVVVPFFHIYGMVIIMAMSMHYGSQFAVLPNFDPETFLTCLQNQKTTLAHLVPPLLLFLAKHPLVDNYDISALDEIFLAAAPVGGDMINAVQERVGVRLIRQGYGLTETSPITHVMPQRFGVNKPDSVGGCARSVSTKVVDPESGCVLGVGEEGELWVTGPNVMKGYLNRPEATEASITPDGWLKTGDVGYYDKDDCFYITDRLKELIKVKGFQVAPAELEAVLLTHPEIADAAVIGVPDERQGESPKAFVVKKEAGLSEREVTEFLASKLSSHKHLTGGVEFIDAIPKSASGKILRRLLRDQQNNN